jgi:hypothetical protein
MMEISGNENETLAIKNSHKNTLMPRLVYSVELLEPILMQLDKKRTHIASQNHVLYDKNAEHLDSDFEANIKLECDVYLAIESLKQIQRRICTIKGIGSITENLAPAISVIRILSARLYGNFPEYGQSLCQLSSVLGSIVMDSATITEAKFDFGQSNKESQRILDEAKLIADSKINKQYPNLDFAKPDLA